MKLNFPLLDEPIVLDKSTILVVEEVTIFAQLIRAFYQYDGERDLKIFNKQTNLKATELMLITDILDYSVNTAPILRLIHTDLEEDFNEKPELKTMIDELAFAITEVIFNECIESELDLKYDELTLSKLIKALNIQIETQNITIFDKMFTILQVYQYLTKKKLLVFVNSLVYFTQDERDRLLEYIHLSQLTVLFVEPHQLDDLPQYILDEDYFLITKNMV